MRAEYVSSNIGGVARLKIESFRVMILVAITMQRVLKSVLQSTVINSACCFRIKRFTNPGKHRRSGDVSSSCIFNTPDVQGLGIAAVFKQLGPPVYS